MERVVHKARGFEEARKWDLKQQRSMSSEERQQVAKTLRERFYGKNQPDVREHRGSS